MLSRAVPGARGGRVNSDWSYARMASRDAASAMPPTAFTSRASTWEWAQTGVLVVTLLWTTLYMGGYRPAAQVGTLLLVVALVLVHGASLLWSAEARRPHPAGVWLLPFVVCAAANVLWVAPSKWLGWLDWLAWAQMAAVFWVTLNGIRHGTTRAVLYVTLAALGVAGVVLGCYQRFVSPEWVMVGERWPQYIGRASGSFSMPNSLAAWLILLLPASAALALRRRTGEKSRVGWTWVALVLAAGLALTLSRGAWLALAVALVAWPLSLRRWRWTRRVRVAVAVAVGIGLASAWLYRTQPQVRERVGYAVRDTGERTRPIMWSAAWGLFREAPLFGTGAGSYDALFERHRPEGFPDRPLFAHNEYLNTLSDHGIVGFALCFGGMGAIAARALRRRRDEDVRRAGWIESSTFTAGLGVGLLAFGLQMMLDFHLKIPALALAFAVVAALAVGNRWQVRPVSERVGARAGGAIIAVGAAWLLAAWWFFVPLLRSEGERAAARREIDRLGERDFDLTRYRAALPGAHAALLRATALCPANGQAWSDLAYAAALMPLLDPTQTGQRGAEAERAAERALALSTVQLEFWIRRGAGRDLQGRWAEAGDDFARAVKLAPTSAVAWGYYADHLARVPAAHEAADAAARFCLRLDPGNPLGLALRQRLAISPKRP